MSSSVWTTSFFNFLTTFMSQQREIFIYCLNFEWWHQHCWVYIFCTMATLWASRSGRGVCCADIWSYCGFLMKGQHCEHPKDPIVSGGPCHLHETACLLTPDGRPLLLQTAFCSSARAIVHTGHYSSNDELLFFLVQSVSILVAVQLKPFIINNNKQMTTFIFLSQSIVKMADDSVLLSQSVSNPGVWRGCWREQGVTVSTGLFLKCVCWLFVSALIHCTTAPGIKCCLCVCTGWTW